MNSFKTILSNQWVQILIGILLLWFLFLKEKFTDEILPNENSCNLCDKQIFDSNNMNEFTFKNKCTGLDGQYIDKSCVKYKAKLDSKFKCNCEIK